MGLYSFSGEREARFNSVGHKCFSLFIGTPHQFWCTISFIVGYKGYVRTKGYPMVYQKGYAQCVVSSSQNI